MKRYIEPDEYGRFAARIVRSYGRRVARADPADLPALKDLRAAVAEAETAAVLGLRAAGFSWQTIGEGLGVTRQAAQQRWGR